MSLFIRSAKRNLRIIQAELTDETGDTTTYKEQPIELTDFHKFFLDLFVHIKLDPRVLDFNTECSRAYTLMSNPDLVAKSDAQTLIQSLKAFVEKGCVQDDPDFITLLLDGLEQYNAEFTFNSLIPKLSQPELDYPSMDGDNDIEAMMEEIDLLSGGEIPSFSNIFELLMFAKRMFLRLRPILMDVQSLILKIVLAAFIYDLINEEACPELSDEEHKRFYANLKLVAENMGYGESRMLKCYPRTAGVRTLGNDVIKPTVLNVLKPMIRKRLNYNSAATRNAMEVINEMAQQIQKDQAAGKKAKLAQQVFEKYLPHYEEVKALLTSGNVVKASIATFVLAFPLYLRWRRAKSKPAAVARPTDGVTASKKQKHPGWKRVTNDRKGGNLARIKFDLLNPETKAMYKNKVKCDQEANGFVNVLLYPIKIRSAENELERYNLEICDLWIPVVRGGWLLDVLRWDDVDEPNLEISNKRIGHPYPPNLLGVKF